MSLFAIAVAVGLSAGYARGGRLGRLGHLRLRAPVLAGLALAAQAGAGLAPTSSRSSIVVVSYAMVGTWLALNLGGRPRALRLGIGLLALGWLLNGVAMAPHGGMPVSATAMEEVGFPAGYDVTDGHLYKHVGDDRDTPVDWLGDVIPVRSLGAVISLGDLALLAGIAVCLGAGMRSSACDPELPNAPGACDAPEEPAQLRTAGMLQEPGRHVSGAPRRRRPDQRWREPAPPGNDGGATIPVPEAVTAASGTPLSLGGAA